MYIIIILFMILSTAIGAIGYNLTAINQTFGISSGVHQNFTRAQVVANAFKHNIRVIDGRVAVPVLANLSDGMPDVVPYKASANGKPFIYCPALPHPSADGLPFLNGSASYLVDVKQVDGMTYVVGGHPENYDHEKFSNLGILAYVMYSQPNSKKDLFCSDVTLAEDNMTLLVEGGSVIPVYDTTPSADGVSFVMTTASKRPSFAINSDKLIHDMSEVASYMNYYNVQNARIKLDKAFEVSANDIKGLLEAARGGRLQIESATNGSTLNITGVESDIVSLHASGALVVDGVSFKSNAADVEFVVSSGASLNLKSVQVGRLRTEGGQIHVTGHSLIASQFNELAKREPIVANTGAITFNVSNGEQDVAILAQDATTVFTARGGDINIASNLAISTNQDATLGKPSNGGRIVTSQAINGLFVDRGEGLAHETIQNLLRVSNLCEDRVGDCTAQCPSSMMVVWGECGSANGAAISGFGVDASGTQYTCMWEPATVLFRPSSPTAAAVCKYL